MHDSTKNRGGLTKNMAEAVKKNDHSLDFVCVIVENGLRPKAVECRIELERHRRSSEFVRSHSHTRTAVASSSRP